jgi:hypothetical protein
MTLIVRGIFWFGLHVFLVTTGAYVNCAECHAPGRPAVAMPATHRSFREGTWVVCQDVKRKADQES